MKKRLYGKYEAVKEGLTETENLWDEGIGIYAEE